ncbi:MAG: hypothetical protein EA397_03445 [Deltaproteobacteria bacterium]|nr:MAG: hypothetical protein EA397_03445 [Deltaproteobacteria bacterium]
MGSGNTYTGPGLHPLHLALFLIGGTCSGVGLMLAYHSFGWPEGPLNSDFTAVGINGLDNIELLPGAEAAVALIVVGIVALVYGNATAWRETGGY